MMIKSDFDLIKK